MKTSWAISLSAVLWPGLTWATVIPAGAPAPTTLHGAIAASLDAAMSSPGQADMGDLGRLRDSLALDPQGGLDWNSINGQANAYALAPVTALLLDARPGLGPTEIPAGGTPAGARALAALLGPVWALARERVNSEVDAIKDEFARRMMNPLRGEHEWRLDRNFQKAREILWYQRSYLDPERDAALLTLWPDLQRAHDVLQDRLRREGRKVGERIKTRAKELKPEEPPELPWLKPDPAEDRGVAFAGGSWGVSSDENTNARQGLGPFTPDRRAEADEREQAINALRTQFMAGEDPRDADGDAYPLNAAKLYLPFLREKAGLEPGPDGRVEANAYEFWQWVRSVLEGSPMSGFEGRLQDDVLKPLSRIGRIGPRGRALIESAREQNEALVSIIRSIKPPRTENFIGDMEQEIKRRDEIEATIRSYEKGLQKAEDKARSRAGRAGRAVARYADEEDGRIAGPLFAVLDHFHWLLGAAKKDSLDPAHGREAAKLVLDGDGRPESPIYIPGLASVREVWASAKASGVSRTLTVRAAAAAALAALAHLAALLALPHTALALIPVAVGAGGILMLIHLIRSGERFGAVVTALVAAGAGLAIPGGPPLAGLGLALGLGTWWLLRPAARALRFRRLGREIADLFRQARDLSS